MLHIELVFAQLGARRAWQSVGSGSPFAYSSIWRDAWPPAAPAPAAPVSEFTTQASAPQYPPSPHGPGFLGGLLHNTVGPQQRPAPIAPTYLVKASSPLANQVALMASFSSPSRN